MHIVRTITNRIIHIHILIGCFSMMSFHSTGQIANERTLDLTFKSRLTLQDSMYILPQSIQIQTSSSNFISYQIKQKTILLLCEAEDSVHINLHYTVLSKSPDLAITASDTSQLNILDTEIPMGYKFPKSKEPGKITAKEIAYSGAFGRGLSFGNNQNVVLNSNLNVQLAGQLGDDIEINAAIADDNLPIQADGNTQQLNEIDKVYIELKRKNLTLLAGDQQLKPDDTYFLRYLKKYKGMQVMSQDALPHGASLETKVGGAIARGNFKRQNIAIQEGNQGPYRLTGIANELFIIVLSASEKVYLDGELLMRGLEHDYIIDYNRSELSFTAKRILNRNSRIVIEFEYSNQSYLKSAWSLQSRYQRKDFTVQWNTYNEQDNKSSNILQTLTAEDKRALSAAGDQLNNLNRSTIQRADLFSEQNNVLYKLKDTVVKGKIFKNILILDPSGAADSYTAQFNFVGKGNGNYIVEKDLFTNGRAYRWVASDPFSTNNIGEYEPVASLTAPKRQMQHAIRMEYKPASGFYSGTEISLSHVDLNLFSLKDHQDNSGIAWKQKIGYAKKLNSKTNWANEVAIEKLNQNFKIFEPFRNPEFNRDWGITGPSNSIADELLWALKSDLKSANYELGYYLQRYTKSNLFTGLHQGWNTMVFNKRTLFKFHGSDLTNDVGTYRGAFFRPKVEFEQAFGKSQQHRAGISYDKERNQLKQKSDLLLLRESFSFYTLRSFLRGRLFSDKMNYAFEYRNRTDQKVNVEHFDDHYRAAEVTVEQQWQLAEQTQWNIRIVYRSLQFKQIQDFDQDKNNKTLLFRQSLTTRTRNNALRYDETIEAGTGQEPALEYTYLKVNKGQGYYTWIDINKDSVLQVTEFELAPFSDQGEYLRYAVTGNEFVKTKNYIFLQNFELDGRALRTTDTKARWYHKLGWVSNWNFNWKLAEGTQNILPLQLDDPGLTALQGQMRNQLFFNKGDIRFELHAGQIINLSKWRLSTGFESRNQKEYFIRHRNRLNNRFSFENYLATTLQANQAEFFKEKNYSLRHLILEPKLNLQPNTRLRVSGAYRYKASHDELSTLSSRLHEIRLECTAQPQAKWSVRSTMSSIWIALKGSTNPWREYNMLQGLRPGTNLLIQINVDREINANTILRLGYNARKSEGSRYIQTGQAQVIASF